MAIDALQTLQASVTKTATFNSTAVDLGTGTPRRGMWAKIIYSAASTSAGAGAATFRITESSDNSTFVSIFQTGDSALTLSTTAISGVAYIPFIAQKRYVRLELSAISGTTATVTYGGEISLVKP
jgi:hypothetical protein